jgi:NAD(P)H-nitrite reductase large subunit
MSGSYGENARRKPHTPSAIVIGGGFAGLAAADALRNASFQVFFAVFFCHVRVLVVQFYDPYFLDENEKTLL